MESNDVFIHEKALVETQHIGSGTRVWAFAHVMAGATIGSHCNICDHCFIESGAKVGNHVTVKNGVAIWDGVTIEDEVFLGPNAVLTNDLFPRVAYKTPSNEFLPTLIKRGATLGANVTVVCGVTVGEQSLIGAGSVVVKDVPAYGMLVGNPAKRIGWICSCSKKLPESLSCSCGRSFELISETRGLRGL